MYLDFSFYWVLVTRNKSFWATLPSQELETYFFLKLFWLKTGFKIYKSISYYIFLYKKTPHIISWFRITSLGTQN